jgi:aryl-alcohol dehydrogenase-like predicted oxidoreductase
MAELFVQISVSLDGYIEDRNGDLAWFTEDVSLDERSGILVPVIGLGTWRTFDVRTQRDFADRRAIVDAALAAGTTLFDTSPMYREAERVLARALDGRRERALVANKVWTPSANEGREQVQRALAWYGGTVDIYQIHNLVAWGEHLPMLEDLRAKGQVRAVGATHYEHSAFRELMAIMRTGRLQMVQIPYNAADREVEREVVPLASELGIGVLVMRPLGAGRLVLRSPSVSELEPLARFGVRTWAQALLKWIVSDPRVHCALPATSHAERAVENAAAGEPPWFDAETREYVARLAART